MSSEPRVWHEGDRVRVIDGSEAHGDTGTIDFRAGRMFLVELDEGGALWPVEPNDIEPLEGP